jgi:hypothetical protein
VKRKRWSFVMSFAEENLVMLYLRDFMGVNKFNNWNMICVSIKVSRKKSKTIAHESRIVPFTHTNDSYSDTSWHAVIPSWCPLAASAITLIFSINIDITWRPLIRSERTDPGACPSCRRITSLYFPFVPAAASRISQVLLQFPHLWYISKSMMTLLSIWDLLS